MDFILHKLRDQGFHFIEITRFFHLIFQIDKFFLVHLYQFQKNHILSGLFQNFPCITADFFKNTVRQSFKAQYINI